MELSKNNDVSNVYVWTYNTILGNDLIIVVGW